VIPAGVWVRCSQTGITDAGYNMSDSISPCHRQSSALATNPARTGFSFT